MTAWTTLNAIRAHGPCTDGWKKLLKRLGKTKADDDRLTLTEILESNGLVDALWCLRTVPDAAPCWRLYAVWCASQCEHMMTDERSHNALTVAHRYALEWATDQELNAASEASLAAWNSASTAASDAARSAARSAASTTARAASDAASASANDAARSASKDAWESYWGGAWAWVAARDAARAAQSAMLCRVFECPTMGKACAMLDAEIRATREKLMEAA